jgi:DNA ligase-1
MSQDLGEFAGFAIVCEDIRATRSKLEKIRILSNYLSRLESDADLKIAVTFLSGRIFPPGESEREVNVGYSILWSTISDITGMSGRDLSKYYLKHGDLGDVLQSILSTKQISMTQTLLGGSLKLRDLFSSFLSLSKISGQRAIERKKQILRGLFSSVRDPLEGKYIVKILSGEMRIGLVEGLVEESIAKCYSKPLEEIRKANLLIANLGEVALLAKRDTLAEATLETLHPTNFMLASSAKNSEDLFKKFEGRPVFAEFKYDGIRAQIHKKKGDIRIFSRNLADVTQFFPELESAMFKVSQEELILDGEIIAFRDGRPLSFQLLQRRLRKITRSSSDAPIKYFAFDILHDGKSLIEKPFSERLKILRSIELPDVMTFSELRSVATISEIQEMFEISKNLGYEGLVAKDPDSTYSPGKRGSSWVKLKKELDTLDVVIVAAEYGHGKRAGVISDYTFAVKDGEELKTVGKAYSGLTDVEIDEMTKLLKSITLKDYGYRRTVRPQVVLEVAFDAIQRSERHDSGFALRFPRIKRIRTDKSVDDIDSIERVNEIYRAQRVRI